MDPPRPHLHITRRHLLIASSVSLAIFAAGGGFAQPAPLALIDHPCEFFQMAEWRFVLAACARLIPETGEGPGALTARVPVFIDRDLAGPFGNLSPDAQDKVLTALENGALDLPAEVSGFWDLLLSH